MFRNQEYIIKTFLDKKKMDELKNVEALPLKQSTLIDVQEGYRS